VRKLFWLPLILCLTVYSSATIALGGCQNGASASSTAATTASLSVTAGDLIVATTGEQSDSTSTATITDSGSNSWNDSPSGYAPSDGGGETQKISYAIAASTTSITVTETWSGTLTDVTVTACNFTGTAASSPVDTSVNIAGSGFISSLTSGTYTTTNANDVLFYSVRMNGGVTSPTAGSGFTIPANGSNSIGGIRHVVQYNIVSSIQSTQTTSMSWTSTARASGAFIAFKPPSTAASGKKPIIIQ